MEDELQALLEDDLDDSAFAYAVASIMACCEKTGPLALYGKDWLAAMLSHWGVVDESERIAMIEPLKHSVYLLKRYDSQIIWRIGKGKSTLFRAILSILCLIVLYWTIKALWPL